MRRRVLRIPWFAKQFGTRLQFVPWAVLFLTGGTTQADEMGQLATAILQQRCLGCHNDQDVAGGLSLSTREKLVEGGESGPAVQFEEPLTSVLLELITPMDGDARMPADGSSLSTEELEIIRRWIQADAPWPQGLVLESPRNRNDWWSHQSLHRSDIPDAVSTRRTSDESDSVEHPIDAFVLAKLRQHGLRFSTEASRRVLIRRLAYDLTGIPPTPEEIDEFIADQDSLAYERLVDRLLHTPAYGERWARHWLDVVQYADTHGYDKDKPRPNAWPYRDYVIRSFNQDKPWSQFILEQISGDVLYPDSIDGAQALGFLAAGPWDLVGHEEVPESKIDGKIARHLDRDDMVRNAIQSTMSLTVGCAQCHDHKFDPIDQAEYYQLQSVFAALDRADTQYYDDPEHMLKYRTLLAKKRQLQREGVNQERRPPVELELASISQSMDQLGPGHLVYGATIHDGGGNFTGTGPQGGAPRELFVLSRGDVTKPIGSPVQPGGLSMVRGLESEWSFSETHSEGDRRIALARWITSPQNPFTWRSIVNRVWQYHFGKGLVESPNDFGLMGATPSHPELLDWLAAEFRDGDQSLKSLHRWIVTSRTYRQSSVVDPDELWVQKVVSIDVDNRLLWRANRRKLEAESIRDSILKLAGKLDNAMGGPAFAEFVMEKPEHSPHYRYDLFDFSSPAAHRRSVYRFTVRSQLQPFLTSLDCADPNQQVPTRGESQSSLQVLAMLNNGLVLTMSEHFSERLSGRSIDNHQGSTATISEKPTFQETVKSIAEIARQVRRGFEEVTGRPPRPDELKLLVRYAADHGLANCCRVLFNLNEFLYVD